MTRSPDIEVVMIAIGEDHQAMAELTKPRVEKVLGLPVNLIEYGEPFEVKLSLLEDSKKPVLFIDCDLILFHWDWDYFDFSRFNAAVNDMHPSWPGTKPIQDLMPTQVPTINSGLWLAHPDLRDVFKLARELFYGELKDFEFKLGDQTPLNLALQRTHTRPVILPSKFNRQYPPRDWAPDPPPGNDYGVHLVGGTFGTVNTTYKRKRVFMYCGKHPL